SVIKAPEKISFSTKKVDDVIILSNSKLQVKLNLINGKISYFVKEVSILSEIANGTSFEDFNDAGTKTYTVSQSFLLDKEEAIYGLGQQQQGKMSKRGDELRMIQGNTDDYIPFFQSNKGYGIFWDNYSPTTFKDTPDGTYFKSDVGDGIDYYFMY